VNSKRTLWYLFHPNYAQSRGNRALLEAVRDLPDTVFVDAYAEYPDWKIDVPREQDRLREHDLIVFQHPFYWYSCPALFREWQDRVLEVGFAYPPKEGKELHGKHWLSVITTGGADWAYQAGGYNNFTISELLRPLQQTANLCGMRWHIPFVVNGVLASDYGEIRATPDTALREAGTRLRAFVKGLDLKRRRTLEPNVPPHYLEAL